MPMWYRIGAVAARVIGFVTLVGSAWLHLNSTAIGSGWLALGFFGGIALLIFPSLPKAYLEQRNRMRGLREGSFQQYLDEQSTKR
jgi:hypothetical protein